MSDIYKKVGSRGLAASADNLIAKKKAFYYKLNMILEDRGSPWKMFEPCSSFGFF